MEVIEYMQPSLKRGRPLTVSGFTRRTRARGAYRHRPRRRTYRRKADASEMKFNDSSIDDAIVVVNGTIQDELLEIPEGVGEEQRIGRKIVIKKLVYRYTITLPTKTVVADTNDTVRIMIIQDKQANGAFPAITDVLKTNFYLGLNNLVNTGRFRTLYDNIHSLWAHGGAGNGTADASFQHTVNGQVYLDLNIPIEYDNSAATGDITTIRSNNIFMLFLSQRGFCSVVGRCRVRFTDR